MIVPIGENKGKLGGAILLILVNKFSMGDDDKITFESFNTSTSPASNKIF